MTTQPADTLADFGLGRDELETLLSTQAALVEMDSVRTKDPKKSAEKQEWLRGWMAAMVAQLGGAVSFDLSVSARERCQKLAANDATTMARSLICLEIVAFRPYYPLAEYEAKRFKGLSWAEDSALRNDLDEFASLLALPVGTAERYRKSLGSATNGISGKGLKRALWVLGGVTLGLPIAIFAPAIGGVIGASMGLSGAAATSAGLAALGGGSLAAGGFGVTGGLAVLVGGGAVLGAGVGGSLGLVMVQGSKEATILQAAKLEVIMKEVILQQKNVAKALEVLKAQRHAIKKLEDEIDRLQLDKSVEKSQIKSLEENVAVLSQALRRNRTAYAQCVKDSGGEATNVDDT